MMSGTQIQRSSLQLAVVTRLRDEIVEGVWRPGVRLQERLLCERYGVSRSPLREAYQVLAAEGLIDLSINRGAVVSIPTPALVMQYYDLLKALELLGIRLACECATEADLAMVFEAEEEMKMAAAANDLASFFRANNAVHRKIVLASKNQPLADAHLIASRHIVRVQNLGAPLEHVASEGVNEHGEMMAALERRDAERAHIVFARHLETVEDNLRARLAEFMPAQE